MSSIRAELIVIGKRSAVWILLALGTILSLFVAYMGPYVTYLSRSSGEQRSAELLPLLPENILSSVLAGFPFYVGMFGLILGVLTIGSEYGWGTLKTALMQQSSRTRLLGAKLLTIGLVLLAFTLSIAFTSAAASLAIAVIEDVAITLPPLLDSMKAVGAAWLVLVMWALFGAMLAVITRGTTMAIGLGILYGLVVEGLISAFGTNLAVVSDLSQGFLRANAYSLLRPLGINIPEGGEPGAFPGPFVDAWQALIVILLYLVLFSAASALVLRQRDVA